MRCASGCDMDKLAPLPPTLAPRLNKLFDANGKLADDATHKFLEAFMLAYDAWVAANSKS